MTGAPAGDRSASARSQEFGARLRRLREAAGLSQSALAGDQLHPSYVSLLESGRRVPTPDVVTILAERLGVPVEELADDAAFGLASPLALAEAAVGLGQPAEAVTLLEPFSDVLTSERCSRDSLLFRAGIVYAAGLENVGRLDEATAQLEVLRSAADASHGRLPWLPLTVSLVRCYRDAGDISRAIDLGEEGVRRSHQMGEALLDDHARLVSSLAGAYAERGDLLRAQLLLDDLLLTTTATGSLRDQAAAYWNASINAVERGNAVEALRLSEQAALLVSLGDDMRSRARLQVTRAWVLLAQTPPQAVAARTLLREALPMLRQYAESLSLASAETELARCELLLDRPDVARRHAESALRRVGAGQPIGRAQALVALGAARLRLGDQDLGVATLEEAAETLQGAQAARQAAGVWRQLSEVFRAVGELGRALEAADRALAAAGIVSEPISPLAVVPRPRGTAASRRSSGAKA